ncbi:MAG: adenylate/guanylate cyclase domain-containing protein [Candidatus Nanopelagicales bacterium]
MSLELTRPEVVIVDDPSPGVSVAVDLRRHVPRVALDWDDTVPPGQQWQVLDASMVFADISGFTALTERLATRGRIGAEELIETLNRVFGAMLSQAAIRGGELLKFGGDALLFLFRGDDHAARACRSAVDMRQALKEAARIPTSVGKLKLSMSVGIHSGPVDLFLVGSPTRELLILGDAGTATTEAEHAAVAGEILVTEGTASQLAPGSTELRDDGLHLLKWRFTYAPEGQGPPTPEVSDERLRTLFPHALGEYLADRVPDPEHKIATIGFARFSGTDAMLRSEGHEAVARVLHETLTVFEEAMIPEGITLLATDIDSDGGKLFMASGVPYISEDDEGRMLRAMRAVIDRGTPLPVQIGVNRGHVFAAEVGTLNRSAYSAMGDTTNTAARIMSKAGGGVLFAHPSVLEHSRTLFATEQAGPFPMKGKAVPVLVYDVGEETGTREAVDRSNLPLVGRDEELATFRTALDRALSGAGGVITVSAPTGLGKSRLVREVLRGQRVAQVVVRAEPYGVTSPYRMLRDPVRAAFGVERGTPEEMTASFLSSFGERLPGQISMAPLLSDLVNIPIPETPESRAIEPQFRPDRIADLVLRAIESNVEGPFVLLVEEGHWADSSSIVVLNRIAAAAAGRPWAVVVARRTEGEGFDPDGATKIELGPLPDEVMRQIVIDATVDAPLRPEETDGIVARAQGNPLFVEELVRVFREVGSLDAMPDSLYAALDAQIDALDPHSRRVLRYASVLGRSFRREVINQTLRGDDMHLDGATLDKLDQFLEADGPTRLRFRNSMIRDAAYEGLAYRLRARLHGAAGRAVETLSEDLEADSDTLALHFSRAGDDPRTWRYATMAGDRAARAYANVDASVHYERALAAANGAGVVVSDRLALLEKMIDVREMASLFDQALDSCDRALKLSKDDPTRTFELRHRRATVLNSAARFAAAIRELNKATRLIEAAVPSEATRRARVLTSSLRAVIRQNQGKYKEALAIADTYLDDARRLDEIDALLSGLMLADLTRFHLGDPNVGDNAREALNLARSRGLLARAAQFGFINGVISATTGRWDDAAVQFADSYALSQEIGDVSGAGQAALSLGEFSLSRGELDEASQILDEASRLLTAAGVKFGMDYAEMLRAALLLARGEPEAAIEQAGRAEELLRADDEPAYALEAVIVRAQALTVTGRADEALGLLDDYASSTDDAFTTLQPRIGLEQARAFGALGRLDEAVRLAQQSAASATEMGLLYEQFRLAELLGELHTAAGDAAQADAAEAEAAAIAGRLGIVNRVGS